MDITTIKQDLVILCVLFLWTSGLSDGNGVNQTSVLWKDTDEDATINCSHTKGSSFYQMYWYRQLPGETLKQILFISSNTNREYESGFSEEKFSSTKPDALSGTLTVKNLVPEDKGLYFCAVRDSYSEAYFGSGTKLTVLEYDVKPPTVEVLRPSEKECRNPLDNERQKTLVCVASGFYPDHVSVSWQVDNKTVTSGVVTDEAALREGKSYKITSQLRVSAEDWYNPELTFKCLVRFFNGTEYNDSSSSISGDTAPADVLTKEEYLRITTKAKLSYGVFIVKSCIYGAFVAFLVWRLQSSAQKQRN